LAPELLVLVDPSAFETLQSLAIGFAFAGLLASGFEFVTARQASFGLLQAGGVAALACVPVVVFAAPFIIIRNTVRGRRFERRPIGFVMAATILACVWSLMSGRLVLDVAQTLAGA
jgi:hypothetical protein